MNIVTSDYINRLANLTEEDFHDEEIQQHLQNESGRIQDILSTVKELLLVKPTTLLTVEDAAYILEEDPMELLSLIEQHEELLTFDGWKEPYLTIRAFFRLATFLPDNPLAQECVCQLLNIALK